MARLYCTQVDARDGEGPEVPLVDNKEVSNNSTGYLVNRGLQGMCV